MNLDNLQRKLISAARDNPPSDRVPYAFEKCITNRIKALGKPDRWANWAQALWRAAAPCVGIALLLAAWSWIDGNSSNSGLDFSQQLENTVLAATMDQPPADPLR